MCLLRNQCWTVVTTAVPAVADQTDLWKIKDNWARGEIHLCCDSEVQDIILDSEHAHDSWTRLKAEYCITGDLKVKRLQKEFSSMVMTEPTCGEFIKRVRRLVSDLKECGAKVKDEDVAFTILLGLGEKFSPLVVTLTNMSTPAAPLTLSKVCEQVLIEELRLNQFQSTPDEHDQHLNNPLAYKSDTTFRGTLVHDAFVARSSPGTARYRQSPYPQGRNTNPRSGTTQSSTATVQQRTWSQTPTWQSQVPTWQNPRNPPPMVSPDVYRTLPWSSAPWQPANAASISTIQEPRICHTCGIPGHTRRQCWQEHPELHPANRMWVCQQLAMLNQSNPSQTPDAKPTVPSLPQGQMASVMEENDEEDHPFELNMVMVTEREVECGVRDGCGVICAHVIPPDMRTKKEKIERRWLLDSGASSHYVKELSRFRSYKWLDNPIQINTGKGIIWGVARGEIEITMAIGKIIIGGVLLVPDLNVDADLLSVSALMAAGLGVNFQCGQATIHREGTPWGVAKGDGGLCYLEEYETVDHYALVSQCIDTQPVEIWHKRLGHLHPRAVRRLPSMATGIKIGEPHPPGERNVDCIDCLRGTQHQMISRFPYTKATRPLERVSADIAGPITPDCTWNYKYIFLFVDHYTRYTWVFPLASRAMALRATQIWKTNAENVSGHRLYRLQTDNAGEFLGQKWTKMCQDGGILHYTTAPYGPSMNSYAERVIRTVVNHASSMLWTAGVQVEFWALAAKASVYLLNRTLGCRSKRGRKTPGRYLPRACFRSPCDISLFDIDAPHGYPWYRNVVHS